MVSSSESASQVGPKATANSQGETCHRQIRQERTRGRMAGGSPSFLRVVAHRGSCQRSLVFLAEPASRVCPGPRMSERSGTRQGHGHVVVGAQEEDQEEAPGQFVVRETFPRFAQSDSAGRLGRESVNARGDGGEGHAF